MLRGSNMIKNIVIYLAILIGTFIFNVFYYGWFSWFLLLIVICIPFISLVISLPFMIIGAVNGITLFAKDKITVGDAFYLGISGKKRPIPFLPQIKIKLKVNNKFAKSKTKQILVYGGTLKKPYYHKVKNVPNHCGCIEADASYCKVYDMLGIFFIPIKINFHLRCNVMPKPKKPEKLDKNDIFSVVGYKPKSGGGYSESYDLRAYQSGDSLKNIHWKLSSKLDEVIIKEPAQPIYRQLIINAVFSDNCDENDDILARMSYVCRYIINKNEVCYCSFNGINASEIRNLDELERYFYAIYTGIGFNECSVDKNCIYYSILPKNEEVSTL